MPTVDIRTTRKIIYNVKELQDLIVNDMHSKGIKWDDTAKITIEEKQIKVGSVPRGQFDEDPIYGLGGIIVTIEEK